MTTYNLELLDAACLKFKLDAKLVKAQVQIESGGHPYAFNPEPVYRYLWDVVKKVPFRHVDAMELASKIPPKDFPSLTGGKDHEWWGQQCSWGLMQIMGAVAREHGFDGLYLSELCDAAVNLDLGCRHLAGLLKWAHGNEEQALAAYNGGRAGNNIPPFRNRPYALKVLTLKESMGVKEG